MLNLLKVVNLSNFLIRVENYFFVNGRQVGVQRYGKNKHIYYLYHFENQSDQTLSQNVIPLTMNYTSFQVLHYKSFHLSFIYRHCQYEKRQDSTKFINDEKNKIIIMKNCLFFVRTYRL